MFNKKPNKIKTGWQKKDDKENSSGNKVLVNSSQIVANRKKKTFIEKIMKWIIYGILFVAIPRYIRSSRSKGKEIVNTTYDKINSNEFAFVPAGYALYLFVSFIPIISLLLGTIGSISERYELVLRSVILGDIIPGISDVIPVISSLWKSGAGAALGFAVFALSVIWLASKGYSKFIFSIDALYRHNSSHRMIKTRVKGFAVSLTISIMLTIFLLCLTAFVTFLIDLLYPDALNNIINSKEPTQTKLNLDWQFKLVYWITVIIFLPIVTYLSFLSYFKFAPNFKLKFSQAHPGALIASIPIAVFILLFGSISSAIDYKKFGVVATFMYVILLLSVTAYFIYTGVIINSSFYHTFINQPTIEKSSLWRRRKFHI
ncbi:ribonuclease BN [[Mycoplasma] phocae]|uniref:Ribonuclease BN n=1 Tax=[Mycoplasma] phocae TaxID=142651 RepID=A0A2Z5ISN2_9BACT|nr:YihY/virulence factor BrkB family protein [[Mycoplasma] phocae]AXE60818.1 ribonuclease BN [[Mycoplasma] phocae]